MEIDGVEYQRSVMSTGQLATVMPDYEHALQLLSVKYNVDYGIRFEDEFLRQPGIGEVLQRVVRERDRLGPVLMPSTGQLAIRAACSERGLVDKYGTNNLYAEDSQTGTFRCPFHGAFRLDVIKDAHRFQFNCQLFNLILGWFYEAVNFAWIEICGSDYAGFWQEQLLWRFLKKPAMINYTPLVSDWGGSKMSKSVYLQPTAYEYLKLAGQEYLLNYGVLRREGRNLEPLLKQVELWVGEPYRLFRGYSIHDMHNAVPRRTNAAWNHPASHPVVIHVVDPSSTLPSLHSTSNNHFDISIYSLPPIKLIQN